MPNILQQEPWKQRKYALYAKTRIGFASEVRFEYVLRSHNHPIRCTG